MQGLQGQGCCGAALVGADWLHTLGCLAKHASLSTLPCSAARLQRGQHVQQFDESHGVHHVVSPAAGWCTGRQGAVHVAVACLAPDGTCLLRPVQVNSSVLPPALLAPSWCSPQGYSTRGLTGQSTCQPLARTGHRLQL